MNAPSLLVADPLGGCCEDEKWDPIPGWPHHEASSCGQVRMLDRLDAEGRLRLGGILPQFPDKRPGKGYLYVMLRDGARHRKAAVAVLVLEAHRKSRPGPGIEACHNDGVRTDNHLSKLRWDTREANLADMLRHREERSRTDGFDGSENRGEREEGRGASRADRGVTVTTDPSRGRLNGRTASDLRSVTSPGIFRLGRYRSRYTSRRAA